MRNLVSIILLFLCTQVHGQQLHFILKGGKILQMEKYDSTAISNLINGISGGSQTLDQTLALGNTTDTAIVFDETFAEPAPSGSGTKEWLRWEPLIKGKPYSTDFAFRQASVNFSFANPLNNAMDEVMLFGWNLAAGGSLEESSVLAYADSASFPSTGDYWRIYKAENNNKYYNWNDTTYVLGHKRGKTAIGESWESLYNGYDNGDMYAEKHEVYVNPLGTQYRLSSYTINTSNESIDFYHNVSKMYFKHPTNTNSQWFAVQPNSLSIGNIAGTEGILMITESAGTTIQINNATNNLVSFTGNVTNYNFSGRLITNAGIASSNTFYDINAQAVIVNSTLFAKNQLYVMDNSNNANYIQHQISSGAINHYFGGNVTDVIYNTGLLAFRMPNNFNYFQFQNTTTPAYIYPQNDLKLNIGVDATKRINELWAKYGIIDQYHVYSLSSNPTTSNIDSGKIGFYKNTTSGDTYIYMNDGGTIKRLGPFVTF